MSSFSLRPNGKAEKVEISERSQTLRNEIERMAETKSRIRAKLDTWYSGQAAPHVLLVDEDQGFVKAAARALFLAVPGVRIRESRNGEAALLAAREHDFDCIITELELGGMPGMTLIHQLRNGSRRPLVPIVLVSAAVPQGELEGVAQRCGANAALAKPFDADRLIELVARLVQGPAITAP